MDMAEFDLSVPPPDKPALRDWAQARRRSATPPDLTAPLRALPEFAAARDVLIYLAMPGEVNVEELASDATKRFYAPRCAPKRRLAVHPFVPGETPLRPGPFGIREPANAEADPSVLDLIVVPALLLSRNGDRLGYGGGYYDRFLPKTRAVTVGVLPEIGILDALPRDPWDVPLGIVVTEKSVYRRVVPDTI